MQLIHTLFTLQSCISQEENCVLLGSYAASNSHLYVVTRNSAVLIYLSLKSLCIAHVLFVFLNKFYLILTIR
jgi:hypothetical protein